jgi:hypothetical protein
MALRRSVLKEENTLCELYADTCSDVSNGSYHEILDSNNSDVPTTSLHKQLRPSAVVFSSDSETSTVVKENSKPESSDDTRSDVCVKLINQAMSLSLDPQV